MFPGRGTRHVPRQILDRRVRAGLNQYLILWTNSSITEASWEYESDVVRDAPGLVSTFQQRPNRHILVRIGQVRTGPIPHPLSGVRLLAWPGAPHLLRVNIHLPRQNQSHVTFYADGDAVVETSGAFRLLQFIPRPGPDEVQRTEVLRFAFAPRQSGLPLSESLPARTFQVTRVEYDVVVRGETYAIRHQVVVVLTFAPEFTEA